MDKGVAIHSEDGSSYSAPIFEGTRSGRRAVGAKLPRSAIMIAPDSTCPAVERNREYCQPDARPPVSEPRFRCGRPGSGWSRVGDPPMECSSRTGSDLAGYAAGA